MRIRLTAGMALLLSLALGAQAAESAPPSIQSSPARPVDSFIRVSPDGPWFVDSTTGERFTPFGLNYTPREVHVRNKRGVTRENWIQFDQAIADRDCQRMADAGANVIRVFLSTKSFVPESGVVPEESLAKAEMLVSIARKHGLRVIFGGPDWWEGETPLWQLSKNGSDWLYGEPQLQALEAFWRVFAARFRDNPGVFSYSLKNEPVIPRRIPAELRIDFLKRKYGTVANVSHAWGRNIGSWEECDEPADADDIENTQLYDYQLAREFVAYRWSRRQVDAIRSVDPNHMVTCGGIQWDVPLFRNFPPRPFGYDGFDPHNFAGVYDYISLHWYDIRPDDLKNDRDYLPLGERYLEECLTYARIGNKPLVLEEFPIRLLRQEGYVRSISAHVAGGLLWEYGNIFRADGLSDTNRIMLAQARSLFESRTAVDLWGPEVRIWQIDKKRLLTWYGDEATFRHNPAWKEKTGSEHWHDKGGYWTDRFGQIRGERPVRIDLIGEGPEFFDRLYRMPSPERLAGE